jgi:cell division protein FtsW
MSQLLQLTVVGLLGFALVMVHSAGMTVDGGPLEPTAFLKSRYTVHATLAIAAMLIASRFNVRELFRARGWKNPLLWMLLVTIGLLALTLAPGVGLTFNGATRWLRLGPRGWGLTFQPSEVAKWSLVLCIACWCARRGDLMRRFLRGYLPVAFLLGAICLLIALSDLGTALLIGVVGVCLLLAGGARWWHVLPPLPLAAGAAVIYVIQTPFRLARLTAFMDPWADPRGAGYHPIQSMLAIAHGGLTGRGLGNGVQKFGYLPEDTSDFLFAVICEELGIGGAVLVVAMFAVLLGAGLQVLCNCRDLFGRLVALGILLTIGIQALINIAVVTVIVPTKGIALPLLSAGGTGWVLTAAAIGLLAALDEANRIEAGEDSAFRRQETHLVEAGGVVSNMPGVPPGSAGGAHVK